MSKVDAMRALREARYAAAAKAPGKPAPSPVGSPPSGSVPSTKTARKASTPRQATPALTEGERCGHRNMGGRSCTRDAGHSEKNHRYG